MLTPEVGTTLNIIAPCSSKKSFRTRELFDTLPDDTRIFMISVRQSHAHDALRELSPYGFVAYNDEKYTGREGAVQLGNERRLIISLESLHRIRNVDAPDFLIMDEVRTLCGVFGGKTLTKVASISTLKRIYQNAGARITLDADSCLDGAVDSLLKGLAGDMIIPVTTWTIPERVLIRQLRVGFKRKLDGTILQSIRTYRGRAPIAIACGRKGDAKAYGRLLTKHGFTSIVYHGESSRATKRLHFSDPDTHWASYDAIIFTSSLSVGVDPRKCVFGKLFLHTFPMGATLRDLFQGLCRFGRFDGGLLDTIIEVRLECISPSERALRVQNKKLKARGAPPTFDNMLSSVTKKHAGNLRHLLDCLSAGSVHGVAIDHSTLTLESFVWELEAWNDLERARNGSRHHEEFVRIAEHRGWNITYVGDEEDVVALPGSPITLEEERRIEAMSVEASYEFVRAYVESEPGGRDKDEFFHNCYGCKRSTLNDTAREIALRTVFFALKNVALFPDTKDFVKIKRHQVSMRNHAYLMCLDLKEVMLKTCEALLPGGEDEDCDRASPQLQDAMSKIVSAGQQLQRLLDVDSVLKDGTVVPQTFIDQIVAETGCDHDPFEPHSFEGKRRMALAACATSLGKVRCKQSDTLALLRTCLDKFNMKLDQKSRRARKRGINGEAISRKRVLESLTLRCEMRHVQDMHLMRCGGCIDTLVTLGNWDAHQEMHAASLIEEVRVDEPWDPVYASYVAETLRIQRDTVPSGVYTELLDADAIDKLATYGEPSNELLSSSYEWVRRFNGAVYSSVPHYDSLGGVYEVPMTYHRKHSGGYGRQWADASLNLQTCPSILRPLIAGHLYHDIDVANCHPKILLDVAKKMGVDVPALMQYVEDREPMLRSLMAHYGCSRCTCKVLILRMLNGGGVKVWKEDFGVDVSIADHEFVLRLLSEVRTLRDMLLSVYPVTLEHLSEYNKHAIEQKNKWSAFSWALCELENRIITVLETHLSARGWKADVLVFDGIMVRRQEGRAFTVDDLRMAEAAVDAAMVEDGIHIRLEEKPMSPDPVAEAWLRDASITGYEA